MPTNSPTLTPLRDLGTHLGCQPLLQLPLITVSGGMSLPTYFSILSSSQAMNCAWSSRSIRHDDLAATPPTCCRREQYRVRRTHPPPSRSRQPACASPHRPLFFFTSTVSTSRPMATASHGCRPRCTMLILRAPRALVASCNVCWIIEP